MSTKIEIKKLFVILHRIHPEPKNLKKLPFHKYEQDFTLIVNDKEYKTSRIVADLLSPTIKNAHLSNSTINEFYINNKTNGKNVNFEYFQEFLNLVNFNSIKLDSKRIKAYSEYFYILENNHEYFRLQLSTLKPKTKENSISYLSNFFKKRR